MNKGKILFYVIFYAALFGFLVAVSVVLYQALNAEPNDNEPSLRFSPKPPDGDLILYDPRNKESVRYWKNELDKFLQVYTTNKSENVQDCENIDKPYEGKVCDVSVTAWMAPCIPEYAYGLNFTDGGPCIFLTLDKIEGWVPEYYNSSTIPSEMPIYLKYHIQNNEERGRHQAVWVDCVGENPADIENIGPISYLPLRGFEVKYFPFTNIEGYLSPLVAVHFERPRRGVLINIECRAWARNIHYDRESKRGIAHFELLVE